MRNKNEKSSGGDKRRKTVKLKESDRGRIGNWRDDIPGRKKQRKDDGNDKDGESHGAGKQRRSDDRKGSTSSGSRFRGDRKFDRGQKPERKAGNTKERREFKDNRKSGRESKFDKTSRDGNSREDSRRDKPYKGSGSKDFARGDRPYKERDSSEFTRRDKPYKKERGEEGPVFRKKSENSNGPRSKTRLNHDDNRPLKPTGKDKFSKENRGLGKPPRQSRFEKDRPASGKYSGEKRFEKEGKRIQSPDKQRFVNDNKEKSRRPGGRDKVENSGYPKTRGVKSEKFKGRDENSSGEDFLRKDSKRKASKTKPGFQQAPLIKEPLRLNRYLANSGLGSRREADAFITEGHVTVNGTVIKELGVKVNPGDEVRFKGRLVVPEQLVYLVMNKPKDCITTSDDPEGRRTVLDLLDEDISERVFPVGRLDRNTTGVLLLTNDGDLAQKLSHPSYQVHKVYKATLNKVLSKGHLEELLKGFELEDGFIQADQIAYTDETKQEVGVEIHSGRNHIIHRMFNHLGYLVDKLDRVSYAGLTKERVRRGEYRRLTDKELQILRKSTGKKTT